jgi:selenocysteine lyase/cysteine desulfurase
MAAVLTGACALPARIRTMASVMIDIDKVRRNFGYLDEVLYLNTAAAGLTSASAGRAAAAFYDGMQSRGYDGAEDWRAVAGRVQALLGRLMNVDPETIRFAGSTTEGLNLVAQSVPVAAGDRVVFLADEFPSLRAALDALASKGAEVQRLACPDEERRTDVLAEAAAGVKIVGVSHVHWCTGTRVNLARLAERCRAEGAILLVDGIQALGATPVDASDVDAYAAATFKWLLAGFGLGVLVVAPSLRDRLRPVFRRYSNPSPSTEIRYGHVNYPGLCALEAALLDLEALGWQSIFQRVAMLRTRLAGNLDDMRADLVTPRHDAGGIISFRSGDAEALVARLHAERVRVSARDGLVRVSPHFYNTESEVDRFCEILASIQGGAAS